MSSPIGRRPDYARVAEWERERARLDVPDHARNLAIANALLAEARTLGVWPPSGPRDIAHKLRIAKAINTPVHERTGRPPFSVEETRLQPGADPLP